MSFKKEYQTLKALKTKLDESKLNINEQTLNENNKGNKSFLHHLLLSALLFFSPTTTTTTSPAWRASFGKTTSWPQTKLFNDSYCELPTQTLEAPKHAKH